MSKLTREQERYLVKLWDTVGPELERRRLAELKGKEYTFEEIDGLLELCRGYDGPPRKSEGMVEMQRLFMKHPDHPLNRAKRGEIQPPPMPGMGVGMPIKPSE